MSDTQVVGKCGNCGGNVVRDRLLWMVGTPPPPRCERCGSTPRDKRTPIDMNPAPEPEWKGPRQ